MKPAAIVALLFIALAMLSFLLYFLLPNMIAFVMGWDPSWGGDVEHLCPAQQPPRMCDCKSEPGEASDPTTPRACCLAENLNYPCWMLRQYLLWFGAICLLLSLISAAYHFLFAEKAKSGSGRP